MWKKTWKRVIKLFLKRRLKNMNINYKVEDLPLEIKPEVREKCNN